MLLPALFTVLLAQPPAPAKPAPPPPAEAKAAAAPREAVPREAVPREAVPLGFASRRFDFLWDRLIPLRMDLDGLQLNSIFFNTRELKTGWLKEATFGTRAQVEVTNTARTRRIPGFAVAVFDKDDHLLGVASGGTKLGYVEAGATETFDLNFTQVKERLPRGDHFVLSVELR